MLTTSLQVNQVVKNYKTLCLLLGEECKGGKSKLVQLKHWEDFIKYEKIGRAYKILEIYHNVDNFPRVSKLSSIENVLILEELAKHLSKEETLTRIYLSPKEITLLLGICNENYYIYYHLKKNKEQYDESIFSNIPFSEFIGFYSNISMRSRSHIYRLTQRLRFKGIKIEKSYIITGKHGKRYATEEEEIFIQGAIAKLLLSDKYNIKIDGKNVIENERDLFLRKKSEGFYEEVKKAKKLRNNDIFNFHVVYKFTFCNDIIPILRLYKRRTGLTEMFKHANNHSLKYHEKKAMEIYEEEDGYIARINKGFLENEKQLREYLIAETLSRPDAENC